MTHDLWASLNTKMIEYLDSISLQVARRRATREGRVDRGASGKTCDLDTSRW
jgi:hypothetical protein